MSVLLLLAAAVSPSAEALTERYRALTAAEKKCARDPDETTVTVCGMRDADRFRVTFRSGPQPGDRDFQNVGLERETLLNRRTMVQDLSLYQVGGGHVGVTVSTRFGGHAEVVREPAP